MNKRDQEFFRKLKDLMDEYSCNIEIEDCSIDFCFDNYERFNVITHQDDFEKLANGYELKLDYFKTEHGNE